jgi:hypothetical protein
MTMKNRMKNRMCMEPGCAASALLHLPGLAREYLCQQHAQAAITRAQTVINAKEERDEHIRDGGKLN